MTVIKNWFLLDKKKGIAGCILGLIAMGICFSWESGQILGIPFFLLFALVGFLKLNIRSKTMSYVWNLLWSGACVVLTLCMSGALVDQLLPINMGMGKFLLNMAIFYAVACLFFCVCCNWKASVTSAVSLLGILIIISSFIWRFRGKELMFVDFRSITTAMNVANQYRPTITRLGFCFLFVWILGLFAQLCIPSVKVAAKGRARLAGLSLCLILSFTVGLGCREIPSETYYNMGTLNNGYCLNFLLGIRDSFVKAPEGYSPESLQALEADYAQPTPESTESNPNIIIIMDESFVDMSVLGDTPQTDRPLTPFLDSLSDNTIRGYALTSVFGGNTANAEFELLTGHSMAMMPSGTVPFQQYIQEATYSLPWLLKSLGYRNVSTHPYDSSGWSRTTVYPAFGFDESTFVEDYVDPEYLRYYISDQAMVDHMIQRLENQGKEPIFLYAISMQNHGNHLYKGDDYQEQIVLEGDYPAARQYLDLLTYTDRAMENFFTYLERCGKDTVVLFFGDHFPHLEPELYEKLHGGPFATLEEQMLQHTVPFLIWANYDIEEQTVACSSMSYLCRYLLEAAGIELPEYYQFLKVMEKNIPAINAYGYYSPEQGAFVPFDRAEGTEAQWIHHYACLQYNNLFDRKHRNETFFGKFLH